MFSMETARSSLGHPAPTFLLGQPAPIYTPRQPKHLSLRFIVSVQEIWHASFFYVPLRSRSPRVSPHLRSSRWVNVDEVELI